MMNARGEPITYSKEHNFYNKIIQDAPDESFHEMTGKKGDVILMHPLMLHSASKNGRRLPRKSHCPTTGLSRLRPLIDLTQASSPTRPSPWRRRLSSVAQILATTILSSSKQYRTLAASRNCEAGRRRAAESVLHLHALLASRRWVRRSLQG
jgi:hypothetical protein